MSKKIIVATDENGLIGKDNQIPWHMPVDLKYFKETTTGQVVVMGSNTYYSLGKPLPNRKNVVISSRELQIEGVEIFKTLEEALKKYDDCFIIGGAKIYKYAIENNLVDEIYLTRIYHKFEKGDAYFNFDDSIWKAYSFKFIPKDEKNIYDSAYLIFKK